MSDFVSSQLAKIAAAREAKLAAKAAAPAAEPEPPAAIVPAAPVGADPAKPADCRQEDWDAMPPDVRILVAGGPAAQAVPVNPPEAAAGLVASATEAVEDAPKRGRGRPPKAPAAPVAVAALPPAAPVDVAPVVAELAGIRAALEAQTVATKELTEAVLGAAQILAG